MTTEQNKALVRQLNNEVHNRHDLSAFDRLVAPTFVDHTAESTGSDSANWEGARAYFEAMFAAVPDFRVEVHEQAAEGDKVFSYKTIHGTHTGTSLLGMPASGKKFSVDVIDILTVSNGQITDHWAVMDALGLLQQLGAIPAMA